MFQHVSDVDDVYLSALNLKQLRKMQFHGRRKINDQRVLMKLHCKLIALGFVTSMAACGGGGEPGSGTQSGASDTANVPGQVPTANGSPVTTPASGPVVQTDPAAAARVATVTLTPVEAAGWWGHAVKFDPVALDAAGDPVSGVAFDWGITDPSITAIDSTGLATLVTPGTTQLSAVVNGKTSAPATLSVRGFSGVFGVDLADNCAADDTATELYCWGQGYAVRNNRLDLASHMDFPNPVRLQNGQFPAAEKIRQIRPGFKISCLLSEAGKAYCWNGTLQDSEEALAGTGSAPGRGEIRPVAQGAIPAGVNLQSLDVKWGTACAVGSDGESYCWGLTDKMPALASGETFGWLAVPYKMSRGDIPLGEPIVDVVIQTGMICALTNAGSVYCAGRGGKYQKLSSAAIPANVRLVKLFGTGNTDGFFAALGSDGWVYSWGGGSGFRYGADSADFVANAWTVKRLSQGSIPATTKIVDVGVGGLSSASCVVGDDGKAYCWGRNFWGSVGDGNLADRDVLAPIAVQPGDIPAGVKLTAIRCGKYHCTAHASDRKFYSWGFNESMALGRKNASDKELGRAVPSVINPVSTL